MQTSNRLRLTVAFLNNSTGDRLTRSLQQLIGHEDIVEILLVNCTNLDSKLTSPELAKCMRAAEFIRRINPGPGDKPRLRALAVSQSRADFIAFIEDDSELGSGWLPATIDALPNIVSGALGTVLVHLEQPLEDIQQARMVFSTYSRNIEIPQGFRLSPTYLAAGYQNSVFRVTACNSQGGAVLVLDSPSKLKIALSASQYRPIEDLFWCPTAVVMTSVSIARCAIGELERNGNTRQRCRAMITREHSFIRRSIRWLFGPGRM